MNCQTFYDYHVAYLQCDVLLLSDIFENFRKMCLDYYELDPLNYISAPGMAWDALLLKTKIELELISDPKILDIVERMKRSGLMMKMLKATICYMLMPPIYMGKQ